ncbi:MalY/PatB family protein [Anaeromicropila populeti]|uniref:cysteine-S-conjugate beta-lyase n=1 Tax=Anaeromicropila populeti TaxID=37658 RepID=A0A1I6KBD4_9FIRM|nr:aminotransferase class I/II-fold pyridoxal phosphate-dependent enzyme [Anaeromicropila populeti]SFR88521.1 Aminotransferase class I and II [Anaeromicropila populeti]
MKYDGKHYRIDFEDLERKLAHPQTTMMVLCNPHNPVGKIWEEQDLLEIGELCLRHHVVVVSDEIHCDLTDPGYEYIPFASVSDVCAQNSITCTSASKAFNLAGLQAAAVVIPSETLRQNMERGLNSNEIAEPNAFAIEGMTAAFLEGEEWLDELRNYLAQNKKIAAEFLIEEIPNIKLVSSHATYLLWLDCSKVLGDATELCSYIRNETGLYLAAGSKYKGNGNHFMRMNIACPAKRLEEALKRLKEGVRAYEKWSVEQC